MPVKSQSNQAANDNGLPGDKLQRWNALPASLPPRGLSRVMAAFYIGVSPSLFDAMVKDGRMPHPKRINTRTIWDVRTLDEAFDLLPTEGGEMPEDWQAAA